MATNWSIHLHFMRNAADRAAIDQAPILFLEAKMGRGILLWLLGVPIPVIIILALLFR